MDDFRAYLSTTNKKELIKIGIDNRKAYVLGQKNLDSFVDSPPLCPKCGAKGVFKKSWELPRYKKGGVGIQGKDVMRVNLYKCSQCKKSFRKIKK